MKILLLITMLLGVGYSQCDPNAETGWNCDCNQSSWQQYYAPSGHNMEGCYLEGANLSYVDLEGANLSGANLSGANLLLANLYGAGLVRANLSGASLPLATLSHATLYEADFSDTNCWGAFFVYANLEDNFWGSPNFEGANLTHAYFDENEDEYDDVSYDAGAESVTTLGTGYIEEGFDYCIDVGANLIASPCRDAVPILDTLPSEIADNLTGIIGQGVAATNQDGNWVGSLSGLGGGNGYWILSNVNACFNYNCAEN